MKCKCETLYLYISINDPYLIILPNYNERNLFRAFTGIVVMIYLLTVVYVHPSGCGIMGGITGQLKRVHGQTTRPSHVRK